MDHLSHSIIHKHDLPLVAIAAVVCIVGSGLTAYFLVRLKSSLGRRKIVQTCVSAIISGSTVWATHFIAMLAYKPGLQDAYEPGMTAISLVIAVLGMALANALLAYSSGRKAVFLAGSLFGLTVSAMHYAGMAAYVVPGEISWQPATASVSLILAIIFGAASFNRIQCPLTQWCWVGGAFFMVLAIVSLHFIGMAAIEIRVDPSIIIPEKAVSDNVMITLILSVVSVILFIGFALVSNESSLERETTKQLKMAATHDHLTGLRNRLGLTTKLEEISTTLANDLTAKLAILSIDLNRFKEVNDLHGHAAGDYVLQNLAKKLAGALQGDEFLYRIGGDEFIALKTDFHRIEQVLAFSERLLAEIVQPIHFGELTLGIEAAVGVATSLEDGRNIDDLLHKSDIAMYRGKSDPDQRTSQYNAKMDEDNKDKLRLVQDLRCACKNGELELNFQLQNDVFSCDPIGFEALLRWNHPERGRVSPGEFIPIAEESGLILDIGLWVLRTACSEAASWTQPYSIAVNVAPQQLIQNSFLENVSDILMETRLAPERLELEITEASIIDDRVQVLKVMHKLKDMGVRIAMDDFGTGYSSLATLQAFPFDKIKIDRSFVQDLHCNEQRAAIVRSTLLLGRALGIPVLAEGVETKEELAFLRSEDCSSVQGFYFGKPMTTEQLHRILEFELREAG